MLTLSWGTDHTSSFVLTAEICGLPVTLCINLLASFCHFTLLFQYVPYICVYVCIYIYVTYIYINNIEYVSSTICLSIHLLMDLFFNPNTIVIHLFYSFAW